MAVADSAHGRTGGHGGLGLPFGYHLQLHGGLLNLLRADSSDVAAFGVVGLDLFGVELPVREDAD